MKFCESEAEAFSSIFKAIKCIKLLLKLITPTPALLLENCWSIIARVYTLGCHVLQLYLLNFIKSNEQTFFHKLGIVKYMIFKSRILFIFT